MYKYGLTLPPDWSVSGECWERFGPRDIFLAELAQWGASSVEITTREETDIEEIKKLAQVCVDVGLALSIHPYLYQDLAPEIFTVAPAIANLQPLLGLCEDIAQKTGQPTPLVFHGGLANLAPHFVPLKEASEATLRFFAWLDRQVETTYSSVRALAETQLLYPDNSGPARIGDTYESCLDLVRGSQIDICWDMGHTYVGWALGEHAELPSEEFLDRVGHLHVHSVRVVDGEIIEDHLPLGAGTATWTKYMPLLAKRHFSGRVVFEVRLGKFDSRAQVEQLFREAKLEMESQLGQEE